MVLYNGGEPCGLAEYALKDGCVLIKKVGIVKGERKRATAIFSRALIFKFVRSGLDICVDCESKYFENLGFTPDGRGGMRVSPDRVVFPSQCHREDKK